MAVELRVCVESTSCCEAVFCAELLLFVEELLLCVECSFWMLNEFARACELLVFGTF
jgi:hypothetical protein